MTSQPVPAFVFAAIGALAICVSAAMEHAEAQQRPSNTLQGVESREFGPIIADGDGEPLYMFTSDTPAREQQRAISRCYHDCASAWPPFTIDRFPIAARHGIEPGLVGSTKRENGEWQATYAGWPLYRYKLDGRDDKIHGQNLTQQGGKWHLIAPDGTVLRGGG